MAERAEGTGTKIMLMVVDKLLLAIAATIIITVLQNRLETAQKRLEKARQLSDIAVDKPLSIVANLPSHLDQCIVYAQHVRAGEIKVQSDRLTELQTDVNADIEGSLAFYSGDSELQSSRKNIMDTIQGIKARALTTKTLGPEDIAKLEGARAEAYKFHGRVVRLSIERVFEHVDEAYRRQDSFWARLFGV